MRQLSTILREEELEKLKEKLSGLAKLHPPRNAWEEFRFSVGRYLGIVYRNGKVVYHETLSELIENVLIEDDCVEVGSDEAGKGESTGPIVVAAVAMDGRGRKFLRARGLLESKSVSKSRLSELADLVRSASISYRIRKVSVEELREVWRKGNLNELLATWHLEVIESLAEALVPCRVIVDSFDERKLKNALSHFEKIAQVIIETNADSKYASVAAASVIARYEYLREASLGIKWL